MDLAVGADQFACMKAERPRPASAASAGFHDYRFDRRHIPGADNRIDHRLRSPCSDQEIAIAIAPGPGDRCGRLQPLVGLVCTSSFKRIDLRGNKQPLSPLAD